MASGTGRFGTASLVSVAVVKKEGEIYDYDFLEKVARITDKLDRAPNINHYQIQDLVKKVAEQIQDTSRSIYSFLSEIISQDKQYADLLYRALKRFQPCLIVNKARTDKDRMLGHSIVNVVQKYLVIDLEYLGGVPMDESVHTSLQSREPYIIGNPDSEVTEALRNIAVDRCVWQQSWPSAGWKAPR